VYYHVHFTDPEKLQIYDLSNFTRMLVMDAKSKILTISAFTRILIFYDSIQS